MKFKLTLEANKSAKTIHYQDKIMLMGSCFTENIGAKLLRHLFQVKENPHGILFNPISVIGALQDYIDNKQYVAKDLFELNEAFASQSLAVIRTLNLDQNKVNINGGAIALGHPLGCTGSKLTVQIINDLERLNKQYGIVTACVGGGQGVAGIIEKL